MKVIFSISLVIILIGCSIPKEYFKDHQEYQYQVILEDQQFELYYNDKQSEIEFMESGTWSYSDSILYLRYYEFSYSPAVYDSIKNSYSSEKDDSVEVTMMYWLNEDKLYYLIPDSIKFQRGPSLEELLFPSKTKQIGSMTYIYSTIPSFEAGKIRGIEKRINIYKTGQEK